MITECKNYFGYGNYKDMYEELLRDVVEFDWDYDFYYKGEQYMISTELIGSKRKKKVKRCFSYHSGGHEKYLETLQMYDTWEELFEKAHFQDGVLLMVAIKSK